MRNLLEEHTMFFMKKMNYTLYKEITSNANRMNIKHSFSSSKKAKKYFKEVY